jgi:hypothetical protein
LVGSGAALGQQEEAIKAAALAVARIAILTMVMVIGCVEFG